MALIEPNVGFPPNFSYSRPQGAMAKGVRRLATQKQIFGKFASYAAIRPRRLVPCRRVIIGAVSGKLSMAPMPTRLTAST